MIVIDSKTSIIVRPLYYCEYCLKPVYEKFGSGRFCSRSCACGWSSKVQPVESKIRKSAYLTDDRYRANNTNKHRVCKNCGKEFYSNVYDTCYDCREEYFNKKKTTLYKKEILSNEFEIPSCDNLVLKLCEEMVDTTDKESLVASIKSLIENRKGCGYAKLSRTIANIANVRELMAEYFVDHSTWDLADELNTDQRNIRKLVSCLNLNLTRHRSSKVHMRFKPVIEEVLGLSTISEYYTNIGGHRYFLDEYCEELNLDIEIDGEWCHNKELDNKRDKLLRDHGINVVRLDSGLSEEELREKLKEHTNKLLSPVRSR